MDDNILKVLHAREQRWEMRKNFADKYDSTILAVTLCLPLRYRISEEFYEIFMKLSRSFYDILISKDNTAESLGYMQNDDGTAFFIASKAEAEDIKRICVFAEENIPGGRMLDIDVMNRNKIQIGRSDIGLPPRKCFICDNPAHICSSKRLHTTEEISEYVLKLKKEAVSLSNSLLP